MTPLGLSQLGRRAAFHLMQHLRLQPKDDSGIRPAWAAPALKTSHQRALGRARATACEKSFFDAVKLYNDRHANISRA
jgi:hypothetical protein